ncbi:MAG: porin family protein [Alistipes sp.]
MKKMIFAAIVALFVTTSVSAQNKGQWSIMPKMALYTNVGDAVIGVGAAARYSISDTWRIEPGITALLHDGCSVDINCDVHYLFDLGAGWSIYPLAGITANDIGKWAVGINLGGAFDYAVSRNWDISAGLKWQPMFDDYRKNGILISVGGSYKF